MSKTLTHLKQGQDFFGSKHDGTGLMQNFGFQKSMPAKAATKPLPSTGYAKGGKVAPAAPMGALAQAAGRRYATGGPVHPDAAADKALVKKGIRQHETQEHGGKHSDIKLRKGGKPKLFKRKTAKITKPKAPPRAMMQPPMDAGPVAPAPMGAPMPDFTDNGPPGGPPPAGITPMRRGGRAGCR